MTDLWDGAVQFDKPERGAFAQRLTTRLAEFEKCKNRILGALGRRADDAIWQSIMFVARIHLARALVRQEVPQSNATIEKQLKAVVAALDKIRPETDVYAWIEDAFWSNEPLRSVVENDDGSLRLVSNLDSKCNALRLAASQALVDLKQSHRGKGRPRGRMIAVDTLCALASIYKECSEKAAGAGNGPFFRFVKAFADASKVPIDESSLLNSVKEALRIARSTMSAPMPKHPD